MNMFPLKSIYFTCSCIFILVLVLLTGCDDSDDMKYRKFTGNTMGTYYEIQYLGKNPDQVKQDIETQLLEINNSLSTYIDSSLVSQFNSMKSGSLFIDGKFKEVLALSQMVNRHSFGAFDPTIMPLVNYWGFGYEEPKERNDSIFNKLKSVVGMENILHYKDEQKNMQLGKANRHVKLDFSAVAKGLSVDWLGHYFRDNGYYNYWVNIGGEVRAWGKNPDGDLWKVGINVPSETAGVDEFQEIIALEDKSIATSGNYRNHKMIDGQKVVHTINPKTGKPEISNLLSASVVAVSCGLADAWATAFMVMGFDEAKKRISKHADLEGVLIYSEGNELKTWKSEGIQQ